MFKNPSPSCAGSMVPWPVEWRTNVGKLAQAQNIRNKNNVLVVPKVGHTDEIDDMLEREQGQTTQHKKLRLQWPWKHCMCTSICWGSSWIVNFRSVTQLWLSHSKKCVSLNGHTYTAPTKSEHDRVVAPKGFFHLIICFAIHGVGIGPVSWHPWWRS